MGDYCILSLTYSDRDNTVRLTCLSLEDPPFLRLALSDLYPLFKGVAAGGGILSEPYCDDQDLRTRNGKSNHTGRRGHGGIRV